MGGWIAGLLCALLVVVAGGKTPTECEKKAHTSLNPAQRTALCENAPRQNQLGPAVCSITSKDSLRLKGEDIIELCQGASNDAPAECMRKLDVSARAKYGMALCAGATSSLPVECYLSLSSLRQTGLNKQAATEHILDFCSSIDDRPPLTCAEVTAQYSSLDLHKALVICADVVERLYPNAVSTCLQRMKKHVSPNRGLAAEKVAKFCAEVNPSIYHANSTIGKDTDLASVAAVECFELSAALAERGLRTPLSAAQRLTLCSNAPVAHGPVDCGLALLLSRDSTQQVRAEEALALCRAAVGAGPASCYAESRNLGSLDLRVQLCNSAKSASPAHCYRRASGVFRTDDRARLELCVGASSEGPAECAAIAPHYLSTAEKIHVCHGATPVNYHDPPRCLQALQSLSPRFALAPKKALGYFVENMTSDKERRSRQLLLQLCALSDSTDPLAAGECFKSVPHTVEHDEAALMCRNISSSEVIAHRLLCYRILPQHFLMRPPSPSDQLMPNPSPASVLCDGLHDRVHVEAAVKCAVGASKLPQICMSAAAALPRKPGHVAATENTVNIEMGLQDVSAVCSTEQQEGGVLHCLRQAVSPQVLAAMRSHHLVINNHTLLQLCSGASDRTVGDCLVLVGSQAAARSFSLDAEVLPQLCRGSTVADTASSLLACLQSTKKRLVTAEDVHYCRATPRKATSARLHALQAENGERIVANQRFSLFFHVLDQFLQQFAETHLRGEDKAFFSLTLDQRNPQGAVLLGLRSNHSTPQGLVAFHDLLITQPGPVELKLSVKVGQDAHVLYLLRVDVQENPRYRHSSHCLYVFTQARCGADEAGADSDALFPSVRGVYRAENYLTHLDCAEKVAVWQVKPFVLPTGVMLVEYKIGLDAMWTGMNMISADMDMHGRLGITDETVAMNNGSSKAMLKLVRRAYYRASLQWHPDRWAGYEQYSVAVRAAFELVTAAYDALQTLYSAPAQPEPVFE